MVRLAVATILALLLLAGCSSSDTDATSQNQEKPALPPQEIEIGDYAFRAYDPAANTQTRFDFSLAGLVEPDHLAGLQIELEKKKIRIRDRVMIVSRESTIEELEDPDLVMFRRRLLRDLNRLIEDGQLSDIYVSHFRVKTR